MPSLYDCGKMMRVVMFRRCEIETHAALSETVMSFRKFSIENYSYEYSRFLCP